LSETYASLEPWPRAKPTPRPSLGLERDLRLAQAPASSKIYASPEPRPRYGPPVSRLPIHGDRTADGTWAMPLPIRGRKRHPLCYQLSSLLHLTFATVSTAGQGRGWEMLNLGTVAIIKHHYSLTQDGERGLGGNCHDQNRARQGYYRAKREDLLCRRHPARSIGTTTPLPLPQGQDDETMPL